MKKNAPLIQRSHLRLLLGLSALGCTLSAPANPVGGTVNQGKVTFSSQGSQFTINQTSGSAYINWQSFNIGVGETTTFLQPSSSSVVWNSINDANPSQILGNLNANGYVILQNQHGFFVGGQAVINTHGLLMTTAAPIPIPDLSSGGPWDIKAPPPTASIINLGQINTDKGGSVFLIAHDIQNHGTISAPQGTIGLYAGQEVLVSDRPDGRGLSARVTLPAGSVDNSGKLIADAGTIALNAQVVNQGGVIQANSVREVNGAIELVASDSLNVAANSTISAQGDTQGTSPGGMVVLNSGNSFADTPTSTITVSGGSAIGRGGLVEIFGQGTSLATVQSRIDGLSASQFAAQHILLVNPFDITLSSAPTDTSSANPNFNLGDLSSYSKITLFAADNITLNTPWTLPDTRDPLASIKLTAGNNITLLDGTGITAGNNWSVQMLAGTGLTSGSQPPPGSAGIYLQGSSFIQTQNGDIDLWAANELIINSGETGDPGNNGIRTRNGGSISVTTRYGDVNAGANVQGLELSTEQTAPFDPVLLVSENVGGISTAAGGDVSIDAGGNVYSYLPLSFSGQPSDAGSGAFGPQPGNVSIRAGGSVFGHYVVANGAGIINAGANAGGPDAGDNIALSLTKGSWTVNAPNGSIYLQEARNPNGIFNDAFGDQTSPAYHRFDYDPDASVTLSAGNSVHLTGLSLPRPTDNVPIILPPTLDVSAGSGGIVLQESMILFPSPDGNLHLTTSAGGSLFTAPNNPLNPPPELVMSDSSRKQWLGTGSFGDSDHGTVPAEVGNSQPVVVNIAGDMKDFILSTSKQTQIVVGGNMENCSFSGQNLSAGDITSIEVTGQIFNRSPYSFVFLDQGLQNLPSTDRPANSQPLWSDVLSAALNPAVLATLQVPRNLPLSQLAAYAFRLAGLFQAGNPGFVYNPTTKRLGFNGTMSDFVHAALDGPLTVLRYGLDGYPIVDSHGHFVTDTFTFATRSAIDTLYTESQGAPAAGSPAGLGYRIGGPGLFNINAGSISLGNSYGFLSCGVGDPVGSRYSNLAPYTPDGGATINVTVQGNLDMITSTIAAVGGGDVNVTSKSGSINLGSQELFNISRGVALGVYTSGRGDVNVLALGDIDVNGSRIAAYNGGNISVESQQGNVDAGSGGTSFVRVPVYYVDPSGHAVSAPQLIFGSGILATTLVNASQVPGSSPLPGNIDIETPQGDISASRGGILQEALNGNLSAGPTVTLVAGTKDGHTGNIDLGDSGVIGGTINATANGNITGLVISRQNSTINAAQSFSGTVLSGGTANLSAGGSISGTVVGIGGINASGGAGVSATLLSQNVSVGGAQAQSTLGTSSSATSTSQAAAQQATTESQKTVALADASQEDDQKKKPGPALTRKTGRVTVILPPNS